MGVILETIGAFVLAAMLTIMVLQMQVNAYQTDANSKFTYSLQAHSNVFKEILRGHLKTAGYNLTDLEHVVLYCNKDKFTFLTDLDNDNLADTVSVELKAYSTGHDPTPQNPYDMAVLVTKSGHQELMEVYGITDFEFTYYDADLNATTTKDDVRIVGFTYKMLSREPIVYNDTGSYEKTDYAMAIADERVFLKNVWDW